MPEVIKILTHHVDEGYFLLDSFTLTAAEIAFICPRVISI
jgi:hypothetical protein